MERHQPQQEEQADEEQECEEDSSLPGIDMTMGNVLDFAKRLRNYSVVKDGDFLCIAQQLQAMAERKIVDVRCSKQTTLDSFLLKK